MLIQGLRQIDAADLGTQIFADFLYCNRDRSFAVAAGMAGFSLISSGGLRR
jgi:hypothetical protein